MFSEHKNIKFEVFVEISALGTLMHELNKVFFFYKSLIDACLQTALKRKLLGRFPPNLKHTYQLG